MTSSWSESLLEQACLKHGLLLLETLQRWRTEFPNHSFHSLLLRHQAIVAEEAWIEMLASFSQAPEYYPTTSQTQVSSVALDPVGQKMRHDFFALILQENPVLVVALLDPFVSETIKSFLGQNFPEHAFVLVSVTPSRYVGLAHLIDQRVAKALSPCHGEDLEAWCSSLSFDAQTFIDLPALIEDLWLRQPRFPVVSPYDHGLVTLIPEEPTCLLLQKTSTQAWVASPNAADETMLHRLYQLLGRTVHLLSIGPNEFRRIHAEQKNLSQLASIARLTMPSLVVRSWVDRAEPGLEEIRLWDRIIEAAIRMGASDIHLEPKLDHIQIRFRVNGELFLQSPLPKKLYLLLLRRAKILSGMRHDQVGLIQDGASWHQLDGQRYDMRTSITILASGEETMVVRIFSAKLPDLTDLQLTPQELDTLEWCLEQENGLFLTSGPTGSGKTTTLYACLKTLAKPQTSIVTIEQPVEKHFAPAKQIDVRERGESSQLTFASALRSVLRQDPDVIMVGEMRDAESAQIAVQAALTGHLVLSTVHANDAVGVIERLCGSFAIDHTTLAYALKLVTSQRLVARLCPSCRKVRPPRPEESAAFPAVALATPVLAERVGCAACRGTGVIRRSIIMELLPIDHQVTSLIEQRARPKAIRDYNLRRGYQNLLHQATRLLFTGEISWAEARSFLAQPLTQR